MKVYDAAAIRNVAVVGHGGCGQDPAGLGDALRRGRRQPAGPGGRRDDGHRLRRRGDRPQAHARLEPRPRRVEQDQDQHHRHAGVRQLPERRARRPARGRHRAGRRRLGGRRRGADREGLGHRRGVRPAAHRRAEPARSRARQPRALARVAAQRLRPRGRARDPSRSARRSASRASSTSWRCRRCTFADDGSGKFTEGDVPAAHRRGRDRPRARRSSRWWPRPTTR